MSRRAKTIASCIALALVAFILHSAVGLFYIPGRDIRIVRQYVLPNGTTIAHAVYARSPGCSNVVWDANDLAVFAKVYAPSTNYNFSFCVGGKQVAAASGRTEQVFPELSLSIGFEGDALFEPFMLNAQKQKRK